ncbi:MAG: hypothetical protein IJX97_03505 [Clostridia bacterium]|nr:hypothetical protein [Clostridia bacterium]
MKKIISVSGIILVILLTLSACKIRGGNSGNSTGSSDKQNANTLNLVVDTNVDTSLAKDLRYEVAERFDGEVLLCSPSVAESNTEIILGMSERAVSKNAYRALERLDKQDLEIGYVIYSDGNSTALAFDQDKYNSVCGVSVVIEKYITLLKDNDLQFPRGIIDQGVVDLIEWQSAKDTAERDAEWDRIAAQIGGELGESIVEASKDYYSMFDSKLVTWMANLYDPDTGAFYYSNSGRNTIGYGPDIESTEQALNFLASTGVFAGIGHSYNNIPDWMKEAMLNWLKPMQDPNGYFYHPQWSKKDTDNHLSRRGRDLERAVALLGICGAKPTYDTITGIKGDHTLIDGTKVDSNGNILVSAKVLLTPLGTSCAEAVSRIVPTAADDSLITPTLRTEQGFRDYLASLDIRGDSYTVGNELAAQAPQFKNRETQLKQTGAGWSLVGILEEWLFENQNKENGLWYYIDESDPAYSIYDGVNGLLKIGSLYNQVGMEFPCPLEAIESAIAGIYTDEVAETVCFAYNTWFAVYLIMNNVMEFSDDKIAAAKQMEEIRQTLLEDAPNSILHTRDKVATFLKQDGSFSYMPGETSANSQGMPVALAGTNEGDINATTICAQGTHGYMFYVLDIDAPKPFGLAEYYLFMHTLENLGSIIKDPISIADKEVITFENEEIGAKSDYLDYYVYSKGSFTVADDPRDKKSSKKVFDFNSLTGGGDTIKIPNETRVTTSCSVFEGEFCVLGGTSGYNAQIMLENIYMLGLKINRNKVSIFDSSSSESSLRIQNDYGLKVDVGEWWKLKVEYYNGDHDTVRIKVFINDELAWVTDNYYDHNGVKVAAGKGTPGNVYISTSICGFSYCDVHLLMDNLASYKTNACYVPLTDPDNQPLYYNVDSPFEDGEGGENEGSSDNEVAAKGEYFVNTTYKGSRVDYSNSSQLNIIEWSPNDPEAATTSIEKGHVVFDKTEVSTYDEYIFWNIKGGAYSQGDPIIFEADVKFIPTLEGGRIGYYSVRNGSGVWHRVDVNVQDGKINIGGVGALDTNTWYNIRFASEVDAANQTVTVHIYINNELIGDAAVTIEQKNDVSSGKAHYYIAGDEAGSVSFDNVYFGYGQMAELGNGKYFNDTESYPDLIRTDYEDKKAQGLYEDIDICTSKVVSGANKFTNTDIAGESDVTEYIVFDSDGLSSEDCNKFVFETDYFVSGPWSTKPNYLLRVFGYEISLMTDVWPGTAIYIPHGGAEIILDTWYNLRIEITKTKTDGSFLVDVYLDGVLKVDDKAVTAAETASTKILISMPASQIGNAAMYFDNVAYGYCN